MSGTKSPNNAEFLKGVDRRNRRGYTIGSDKVTDAQSTDDFASLIPQLYAQVPNPILKDAPYLHTVYLQRLVLIRCSDPKLSAPSLAALCRAFDVLEERKRILRNRPLPGQLRPDLDPVQLAKTIKRSKARMPHDIGATIQAEAQQTEGSEEPAEGTEAEEPSEPSEPTGEEAPS